METTRNRTILVSIKFHVKLFPLIKWPWRRAGLDLMKQENQLLIIYHTSDFLMIIISDVDV